MYCVVSVQQTLKPSIALRNIAHFQFKHKHIQCILKSFRRAREPPKGQHRQGPHSMQQTLAGPRRHSWVHGSAQNTIVSTPQKSTECTCQCNIFSNFRVQFTSSLSTCQWSVFCGWKLSLFISLCIVDASKTRIFISFFERSFHPLHLRIYITNKMQIITYFNRLPPVDNVI